MRKLFVSLLLGAASLLWSAQGMEKPFYEKRVRKGEFR